MKKKIISLLMAAMISRSAYMQIAMPLAYHGVLMRISISAIGQMSAETDDAGRRRSLYSLLEVIIL